MKILQLTKKLPFPLISGEAWAISAMSQGLKRCGAQLDLFSLVSLDTSVLEDRREYILEQGVYDHVELIDVDIKYSRSGALINLLGDHSYHAVRFDHKRAHHSIQDWLNSHEYDVILIETIYMMCYEPVIRTLMPKAKVVLRAHNAEFLIWERYASGLSLLKSWYFKEQSRRLKKYEIEAINKADFILPVSDVDASHIRKLTKKSLLMETAPIGIFGLNSEVGRSQRHRGDPIVIGYIGLLDWRPNIEGLHWFLHNVWPQVVDTNIEVVLKIAGKNQEQLKINDTPPQIRIVGDVADSDDFIASLDVMIVPLLSGSGTRVKILQAMRLRTPVICTSIAKEGLDLIHDQHVRIANTPSEWIESLVVIERDVDYSVQLTIAAYNYLGDHHNPDTIACMVKSVIESL